MTKRAAERSCKATNRHGQPCRKIAISEELCLVHMPGGQDMRALGRAGGKARRGGLGKLPPAERESLREELRKLDPAIVRGAIEQALSGGNESARVSAVKLLADIDAFSRDAGCPVCAQVKAEAPAARDKLNRLLEAHFVRAVQGHDAGKVSGEHDSPAMTLVRRAVARAREGHQDELQVVVEQALKKTVERLKHADIVVENDVSPEEAQATFAALEEVGLLVPRGKVAERAEQIAQERLQALKAEHGLAGL